MKEFFEQIGCIIVWLAMIALIAMFALLFIEGGLWLSKTLYPFMYNLSIIAFAVCFILLLPMSLFKKTKNVAAAGLMISSLLFGTLTWMCAFIAAFSLWGYIGLLIGICIGGIGVVPIAILATLFNGQWSQLVHIILLLVVTFGFRFLAISSAVKN